MIGSLWWFKCSRRKNWADVCPPHMLIYQFYLRSWRECWALYYFHKPGRVFFQWILVGKIYYKPKVRSVDNKSSSQEKRCEYPVQLIKTQKALLLLQQKTLHPIHERMRSPPMVARNWTLAPNTRENKTPAPAVEPTNNGGDARKLKTFIFRILIFCCLRLSRYWPHYYGRQHSPFFHTDKHPLDRSHQLVASFSRKRRTI